MIFYYINVKREREGERMKCYIMFLWHCQKQQQQQKPFGGYIRKHLWNGSTLSVWIVYNSIS